MKKIMNKKTLSLFLLLVFLAAPLTNSYGWIVKDKQQSSNKGAFGTTNMESRSSSSSTSWLRGGIGTDNGDGLNNGGAQGEGDEVHNDAPIGTGLWILLPLVLGYSALRFRQNRIKI